MNKEKLLSNNSAGYVNYTEYLESQTKVGLSLESENWLWLKGLELYIEKKLKNLPIDTKIADIACGDGVGLKHFRDLGFTSVEGFELSPDKAKKARAYGYPIHEKDIHNLNFIEDECYDVIYSSHTLEHLLDPLFVLDSFKRILKDDGKIFVVLPYGHETGLQRGHWVHCGVEALGLDVLDEGKTLINKIENIGYKVLNKQFENYRESEIWLDIEK